MQGQPYTDLIDLDVIYEVDWSWNPLYEGRCDGGQRDHTGETIWAIKKFFYEAGVCVGWKRAWDGPWDDSRIRDDRATYF